MYQPNLLHLINMQTIKILFNQNEFWLATQLKYHQQPNIILFSTL